MLDYKIEGTARRPLRLTKLFTQTKLCDDSTAILQMAPVRIKAKGYHPAECIDQSQCIGCALCARMCPDCAITVEK